jgi:hypothetical protein
MVSKRKKFTETLKSFSIYENDHFVKNLVSIRNQNKTKFMETQNKGSKLMKMKIKIETMKSINVLYQPMPFYGYKILENSDEMLFQSRVKLIIKLTKKTDFMISDLNIF